MENPTATLHCPNHRCQAANPQSNRFCQNCSTPLLRRYLWAIGSGLEDYKMGEAIANRYLLVAERILLDTEPAIPPDTPEDIPAKLLPYLRLSPYRLHIPQIYGRVTVKFRRKSSEIWLLEQAPISTTEASGTRGQIEPELLGVWKDALSLRQLNWLWQWTNLWQPLSTEGVATSLLNPALLRVEGSILRLLELQPDPQTPPTLQQLGQFWSELIPAASPQIKKFYQQLCTQLTQGEIRSSEQLIELIDQGIVECDRISSRTATLTPSRRYQIFTLTDPGPSRSNNEDACYPPSGQLIEPLTNVDALAIVCDGVGGQDGGEIASQLAIEALREQVEKLPDSAAKKQPTTLTIELEQAVCNANDLISQRNDREQRFERQRMGTTAVMARTAAHEIYITHVGDSRVYWITQHSCHQITQDDDLASREVRLGYSLYRDAVQQPSSGALVQALGMAPSATLHPTVQRFVLDEDSVFLLCSDGLSDYDRVDQYWQTEILPILQGQIDLPTAVARLIEIANRQNGHDNVTVALVYCQVTLCPETRQTELSVPEPQAVSTPTAPTSQMKTQQLPTTVPRRRPWRLLAGIFLLLGLGGVLAYLLLLRSWVEPIISLGHSPSPTSLPTSPQLDQSPVSSWHKLTLLQVNSDLIQVTENNTSRLLLSQPSTQKQSSITLVPAGSILQVTSTSGQQQNTLLYLKICTLNKFKSEAEKSQPATNLEQPSDREIESSPGEINTQQNSPVADGEKQVSESWIKETELQQMLTEDIVQVIDVSRVGDKLGNCNTPTNPRTNDQ